MVAAFGFQVENAVGRSRPLGGWDCRDEIIRAGLETFGDDLDHVPGRFNLLEVNGAAVVVDYGHNTSSLMAMLDALKVFPHQNRIAVYTAAGDRRDGDMVRQGELLAESFDRVILYEDHYVRGRKPGEIMRSLPRRFVSRWSRETRRRNLRRRESDRNGAIARCSRAICFCCRPTRSTKRSILFANICQRIRLPAK